MITERVVEPRLGEYHGERPTEESAGTSVEEARGLRFALYGLIGIVIVIALLALPLGRAAAKSETGALIGDSPLMNSLIVLIMLLFLVTGFAYGKGAGTINNLTEAIAAITKTFAGLGGCCSCSWSSASSSPTSTTAISQRSRPSGWQTSSKTQISAL